MKYYTATYTGKGFITHEDNESSLVNGYPSADVWLTDNTDWAVRVGAVEITKEEAQALVDAKIAERVSKIGNSDEVIHIDVIVP